MKIYLVFFSLVSTLLSISNANAINSHTEIDCFSSRGRPLVSIGENIFGLEMFVFSEIYKDVPSFQGLDGFHSMIEQTLGPKPRLFSKLKRHYDNYFIDLMVPPEKFPLPQEFTGELYVKQLYGENKDHIFTVNCTEKWRTYRESRK